MANLKDSITKGITAINVKTNNFMEESKCKTYISTLENEIKDLKLKAGEKAYDNWCKGEEALNEIEELFQTVKEKYKEIDAQKERIAQLAREEKQILGAAENGQPQAVAGEVIYCSNCGAQNSVNYKFCGKCGTPLK